MTLVTQRVAINQNIEWFRQLLATGNDELARTIIPSLLATEKDKMAKLEEQEALKQMGTVPPSDEQGTAR
jgi:hypothetical protein